MRSMDKNVRKTFDLFEDLYTEGSDFGGLKVFTGFSDLDSHISGLHLGDLVAVIGEAGSGKTAFLLNVALNIADQSKRKVLFYSLQYPIAQLVMRMICIKGQTSYYDIIRGYVLLEDYHKMTSAACNLLKAPLLIQDGAMEDVDCMLRNIRLRLKKLREVKLVIIDSIDMFAGVDMVQYAECLRKLKAAAVDMNVPILVSAYIPNKRTKKTRKANPSQDRLQAIEIYADTVLHIRTESGSLLARYNDVYKEIEGNPDREYILPYVPEIFMAVKTEIAIIKNTYGPKGSIFLTFVPRQFTFEENEMESHD